MQLLDELQALCGKVSRALSGPKLSEEGTKTSLIMPFLKALGYDVFDLEHVHPEYIDPTLHHANRNNPEKVDYALLGKDKLPFVFLEAKLLGTPLDKHGAQLQKYFNNTKSIHFGILTDGRYYRFFADLDNDNIMDDRPFFVLDMLDITDEAIDVLQKLHPSLFDVEPLREHALTLRYRTAIKRDMMGLIEAPSPELVKLLIDPHYTKKKTDGVVANFTPIVKQAIIAAIKEMLTVGLPEPVEAKPEPVQPNAVQLSAGGVVTTEEELNFFNAVQGVLAERGVNPDELMPKDTLSYFNVSYKTPTKWFVRLFGNGSGKATHVTTLVPLTRAQELLPDLKMDAPPVTHGLSRIYETDPHKLAEVIYLSYLMKDNQAAVTPVNA